MPRNDSEINNNDSTACAGSCGPHARGALAWALVAAALLIASALVIESTELAREWQLLIVLIPMVPFAGMLVAQVRVSRSLDEMQRRVQLEALGLCVVLASGACVLLGQLQKIDVLGEINLSMAMVVIVAAYAGSYALVSRRYR